MSNIYVGQIQLFAMNFAPRNFALCQGQLLPISQYTALFSLLGVQFGGDGRTNFALPDLRGRVPVGSGNGPGLSPYVTGEVTGTETVTVLTSQMPAHTHTMPATSVAGHVNTPANGSILGATGGRSGGTNAYAGTSDGTQMAPQSVVAAGSSLPHNNLMPYLTLNYCIALAGVFPPRN